MKLSCIMEILTSIPCSPRDGVRTIEESTSGTSILIFLHQLGS
jgi:hypothetical protein